MAHVYASSSNECLRRKVDQCQSAFVKSRNIHNHIDSWHAWLGRSDRKQTSCCCFSLLFILRPYVTLICEHNPDVLHKHLWPRGLRWKIHRTGMFPQSCSFWPLTCWYSVSRIILIWKTQLFLKKNFESVYLQMTPLCC